MPDMDGTGPRCGGHRMHGGCGRHGAGSNSAGCMHGMGLGRCHSGAQDDKETLTLQKEVLQRSLSAVEKRLETL